ncbi:MAG: glycerophosphodiester phosphodiesterase family protein [Bariatricus massiliensis]|nr:glycerophosphodiester phosphodiesterase family protein [Bariatricus massiliensis]
MHWYVIIEIVIFFIIFYIILIMPNFTHREAMKPFLGLAFAHRGLHDARKLIPENSMYAFKEAVRHKLAIELDIHLTRDNQVVVFHDELLERVCGVPGTVEDSTYEELRMLHLLNTDEHIPLFKEVLDYIDGRVPLLIELKLPTQDMRLCSYAMELLSQYEGAYLVQSFNSLGMRWFKQNAPDILRGQLSSALTKSNKENPYIVRFCVQHLLTNILCRPDFISYKLADAGNPSLRLVHRVFKTPAAVWTLRTEKACRKAVENYDMYIFEHEENVKCFENVLKNKQNNL